MKKSLAVILVIFIIGLAAGLRLFQLDQLPPALYWEEAALGYDAYAILTTGSDHHGNRLPLVAFESFGDWKPSLYFYAIVPFIWLLGLGEWAVRLPAAISGVVIVLGVGRLAFLLTRNWSRSNERVWTPLVAMAVTAISPWAVQFSRAGWETNLATALLLWGVVFGLSAFTGGKNRSQRWYWILAAILLTLSMYAYHAARVIGPLLGLGLVMTAIRQQGKQFSKAILSLVMAGVISLGLVWPLITQLGSPQTTQRFAETSIFTRIDLIEQSNQLREQAGNTILARLFYHRYIIFGQEIARNFVTHFDFGYLFLTGDNNPRHSVQFFGQLYYIEVLFLLLGLYRLIKMRDAKVAFLGWWLVVGIVPAAISTAVPHALRTLSVMPIFMVVIAAGVVELITLWKTLRLPRIMTGLLVAAIVVIYGLQLTMFWRYYTRVYPVATSSAWQYGYQQMLQSLASYEQTFPEETVYISRDQGRPAMYYWFYNQTDPRQVQAAGATSSKDQGELLAFENKRFIRNIFEVTQLPALLVTSPSDATQLQAVIDANSNGSVKVESLNTINDLNGTLIWIIYRVTQTK